MRSFERLTRLLAVMLIFNSFSQLSGANAESPGTIVTEKVFGGGFLLVPAPDGSLWMGGGYNTIIAPTQLQQLGSSWSRGSTVNMADDLHRNTGGWGAMTVGSDGSLWATNNSSSVLHASNLGGAWFVSPQIDTCSDIRSLATTTDGSIWVGCGDAIVQQITGSGIHWTAQNSIPLPSIPYKNIPIKLVGSSDGSLWIVSPSNGMVQQLIKVGSTWTLQAPLSITGSFSALAVGLDGSLWITNNSGERDGSLIHLVKTNGSWTTQQTIAVEQGPLDLAVATNGSVWVMNYQWVQQFVNSSGQWNLNYSYGSGGNLAIAATSDGSVFLSNANAGLTRFYSIAATPPSPPLNVKISNGEISFSAPSSDGGSPITSYLVNASQGSTVDFGTRICSSLMPLKCVLPVNNHLNDITYFVYAINRVGQSQASTLFVGKATSPSAPTDINLTPGDSEITVSWTQSVDQGNMPTVTYSVQAFPGGNRCQSIQSSNCTVTGLSLIHI